MGRWRAEQAEPQTPWGRCPRCRGPLIRDRLPLQAWPEPVSMEGPPYCRTCTPEEIESYLAEWGAPPVERP